MAKTAIIQLYNVDGNDLALFAFDPAVIKEQDAAALVEQALEAAFQKDEAGEVEDGDILTEAEEALKLLGIDRIYASIANTDRL